MIEELNCYQELIPGAYKSDLARLCLIYVYGGIYLDIGMSFTAPIEEIIDVDVDMCLCKEKSILPDGIFNGFFASSKENPFI